MARLNTKRMMNILAADKKKQEAAQNGERTTAPSTPQEKREEVIMVNPRPDMTGQELTQYLAEFLAIVRAAKARHTAATAAEEHPNSAIQDILHAAELAPSLLDAEETLQKLTAFRRSRRDLKKELEITNIFLEWVEKHPQPFNQLDQALGAMRKVINRQPYDAYRFKTGAVGIQGEFMKVDEEEADNGNDS